MESPYKEERFSISDYLEEQMGEKTTSDETEWAAPAKLEETANYRECLELVRTELIESKGRSEQEQRSYTEKLNQAVLGFPEAREYVLHRIEEILLSKRLRLRFPQFTGSDVKKTAERLFSELIGLSALEWLLKEKRDLEEIQVVGTRIYEVRNGEPTLSKYSFERLSDVIRLQQNFILLNNDRFSPRKRWAEVNFIDGSRVTLTGFGYTKEPTITLRFYPVKQFHLSALTHPPFQTLDERLLLLLRACIHAYFNFIIIGATNSGKTHLMKCMIGEMKDDERIITIESRSELMLSRDFPHKNIIEYEVDENDPQHDSNQAFKLALRQSPKRIVHAEIRDDDANTYVRACTRGHDGSMTTVHASSLDDVPDVIAEMCMMDRRPMNAERLRSRIAQFVTQIGIEMALIDGKRRIQRVVEYESKEGEVVVRELVKYEQGSWKMRQMISDKALERIGKFAPDFMEVLREAGWISQ